MTKNGIEHLTASKGDYLKVLYDLDASEEGIRTVDIAKEIKLSIPSVSRAMKELAQVGYVSKARYGTIKLTGKGLAAARRIKKRYELLVVFLTQVLNVERPVAMEDACRMEHVLSCETTGKLEKYIQYKADL